MSRPNSPLSDSEIRSLLAQDPPQTLSSAQRSRLRIRLGLGHELGPAVAPPLSLPGEHFDDPVTGGLAAPRHHRPLWLAAAVLVVGLLAAVVGGQVGNRDGNQAVDTEVVAFPAPGISQESTAASVCLNYIGPFTAGVDTWDGVDNWAFLTDKRLPEPDLVDLALAAISAVEGVTSLPQAPELTRMLAALRRGETTGAEAEDPFAWTATEREAHRQAVNAALDEMTDVIDRETWAMHEGCD